MKVFVTVRQKIKWKLFKFFSHIAYFFFVHLFVFFIAIFNTELLKFVLSMHIYMLLLYTLIKSQSKIKIKSRNISAGPNKEDYKQNSVDLFERGGLSIQ